MRLFYLMRRLCSSLSSLRGRTLTTCLSLSPGGYIQIYIGAIVVFAVLYWMYADDFYHPYAKYEPSFALDKEYIVLHIANDVLSHTIEAAKNTKDIKLTMLFPSRRTWLVSRDSDNELEKAKSRSVIAVDVGSLETSESEDYGIDVDEIDTCVHVSLAAILRRKDEKGEKLIRCSMILKETQGFNKSEAKIVPTFSWECRFDPMRGWLFADYGLTPAKSTITEEEAFRFLGSLFRCVPTSKEAFMRVQRVKRAMSGFPSEVSGSLGRLLYLSAVTITTVGYGDIVPLTGRARFLVACEATVGIILLGLFVNSLWSSREWKKSVVRKKRSRIRPYPRGR